jgi:uncharacterized protein
MYLSGIPPEYGGTEESPDLRLTRPEVYFGSLERTLGASRYGIVSAPSGRAAPDFPQGIQLDGALKKVALAWRFRDANLLFSSEVSDSSRFIFRRHVRERAEAIAPFFRYPELPYPVIVSGRIVWVLEGFSTTRSFPLGSSVEVESGVSQRATVTYLRNSVKVTVDAVSGETRFYSLPVDDPLRDAYAQAFPGVLQPIEQMPAELREHLRYSTTMLTVQAAVLARYHQETAARFHGQQDVWDRPQELSKSTSPVPYLPEYGLYRLPDEQNPTFNLTTAFVPAGRQNLTALIVGRLDEVGVPQLLLYDVPVEDQAPGPRQVEALIEQDPEISQEFSLWRSGGSQVWTGHLHIVPVGTQLFFMEPVFLAAADQAIPELRRFVVSDGRRVAMEPSLGEAIAVLTGNRLPAVVTTATGVPGAGASVTWAREALGLLERAESRLRASDYAGFGASIQELRRLLERASTPAGGAAPKPPAPDN